MITIEVCCRACREIFVPSSADIRRGIWKWCPPCRDGPERRDGSTAIDRHDEPATGTQERFTS